jgi:hypothetical protein
MIQAFISYNHKDNVFSQQVTDDLRDAGIPVWKAPESIQPGESWVEAIERGLVTSTHLVLLMSPAAVESWWVNWEFNTAMALHARGQIEILPLDYLPCNPPLRWQGFQALRGIRDDYEATISKLIKQIQATPPDQPEAFRRNLRAEYLYQIKLTISTPKPFDDEQSDQLSILEDYTQLERIYLLQQIIFHGDLPLSMTEYPLLRIEHTDISFDDKDDNIDYGFSFARKALESSLIRYTKLKYALRGKIQNDTVLIDRARAFRQAEPETPALTPPLTGRS